jgi:enterochelin esterase-like enzyme
MTHWFVGLGSLLVALSLVAATPLQQSVQQAILLGPDSLFPPPAVAALTLVRAGRTVHVRVEAGIVFEHLSLPSRALHGQRETYDLYVPPDYTSPTQRARRYPTLYLLHGAPGQPDDWLRGLHIDLMEDQGVASGAVPRLIIVMPEGNGGLWRDSQYVNTHAGFRAEDLIAHDVVRYVDAHYRTIADRGARALAGISEGGYGAVNLGLKHRDTFSTLVSVSGYFAADPAEVWPGNDPWGQDRALMQANSPLLDVPHFAGRHDLHILLMDNTADGAYTRAAVRFDRLLTRWHVAHTLVLQPVANPLAAHTWAYWRTAFHIALAYVGQHVLRAPRAPGGFSHATAAHSPAHVSRHRSQSRR